MKFACQGIIVSLLTASHAQSRPLLQLDTVKPGVSLPNWHNDATNPVGPIASWQVQKTDQQNTNAYAIDDLGKVNDSRFNLTWQIKRKFLNLNAEVVFKARSGKIDQGGGVVWRLRDARNYYIARYNPLEDNFRIYFVKDGVRKVIASVRIQLDSTNWHRLQIIHKGEHIQGSLNGKKLLDVRDSTFLAKGYVGLWTKADAVTFFRNLTVDEM